MDPAIRCKTTHHTHTHTHTHTNTCTHTQSHTSTNERARSDQKQCTSVVMRCQLRRELTMQRYRVDSTLHTLKLTYTHTHSQCAQVQYIKSNWHIITSQTPPPFDRLMCESARTFTLTPYPPNNPPPFLGVGGLSLFTLHPKHTQR